MKGTVKWFDSAKGYGFIKTEEGSDIFVHYTVINKMASAVWKKARMSSSKWAKARRASRLLTLT